MPSCVTAPVRRSGPDGWTRTGTGHRERERGGERETAPSVGTGPFRAMSADAPRQRRATPSARAAAATAAVTAGATRSSNGEGIT